MSEADLTKRVQAGRQAAALLASGVGDPGLDLVVADGRRARGRLLDAHMGLVARLAARFRPFGTPLDDMVQEGVAGMLAAIDQFEPQRGLRLSTLAAYKITASVADAAGSVKHPVGVPRDWRRLYDQASRLRARLTSASGTAPSDLAVAAELGISVRLLAQIDAAVAASRSVSGLDSRPGWEPSASSPSPEGVAVAADERARVRRLVASLGRPRSTAVALRFGLIAGRRTTIGETARLLEVAPWQVVRWEQGALRLLRHRTGAVR